MAHDPRWVARGLPLLAFSLLASTTAGCRSAEHPETAPGTEVSEEAERLPAAERSLSNDADRTRRKRWETTQRLERAVLAGLRWLARHQSSDGSWGSVSARSHCPADAPCFAPGLHGGDYHDEGLTGLVLLGFLRAGFGPESRQSLVDPVRAKRHRLSDIVGKGLDWLRARQKPDGSFTRDRAFLYNEAIASLALVEAYDLTKDPALREPAQRAVGFLQAAQRPSPDGTGLWGWRYASRQEIEERGGARSDAVFEKELHDADTSITAWCLLALDRARDAGLEVDPRSIDGAMAFCEFVTADNGLVGYLDRRSAGAKVTGPFDDQFTYHPTAMSALGMCIRIFASENPDDSFLELGAKRIVQDLPAVSQDHASIDYYYWHAATVAFHQIDGPNSPRKSGKYWNPWREGLLQAVLSLQDHTELACAHGGWIANDRWGSYSGAGPLYATALNVLTLEVPLQIDNVFDRSGSTQPGDPAPDFEGSDGGGSRFMLSQFRGSVVLIDFWNSLRKRHEEDLEERIHLADRMCGRPFAILGIARDWERDQKYLFTASLHGQPWRWTRDRWGFESIHWKYGAHGPTTVVVDAHGTIRGRDRPWEETVALIDRLVGDVEARARPR